MHVKKRGFSTILYFRTMGVVIAVAVFIILFNFVKASYESTLFDINFRARDISLLLTTVYAAPGDVDYYYDIDDDFLYLIEDPLKPDGDQSVIVTNGEGAAAAYFYAKPQEWEHVELSQTAIDFMWFCKRGEVVEVKVDTTC